MRKQVAVALASAAILLGGIGMAAAAPQQAAKPKAVHHTMAKGTTAKGQTHHISGAKLSRRQIRQMQTALNKMGFDAGHVDGRLGPHTRKAVKNFQSARHIQGQGIDQRTLQALGITMRGSASARTVSMPNKTRQHARGAVRETTGAGSLKPARPANGNMQKNDMQKKQK